VSFRDAFEVNGVRAPRQRLSWTDAEAQALMAIRRRRRYNIGRSLRNISMRSSR
jgi:hypothetical protein